MYIGKREWLCKNLFNMIKNRQVTNPNITNRVGYPIKYSWNAEREGAQINR